MKVHVLQIIETGAVIVLLLLANFITRHYIKSFLKKFRFYYPKTKTYDPNY